MTDSIWQLIDDKKMWQKNVKKRELVIRLHIHGSPEIFRNDVPKIKVIINLMFVKKSTDMAKELNQEIYSKKVKY